MKIIKKSWSKLHKPLKSFLSSFTYRTDPRRFIHCTKISANLASPYRFWKFSCKLHSFHHLGSLLFFISFGVSLRFRRSPFRNWFYDSLSPDNLIRNVKCTVTGSVVVQIRISIIAGTDNIQVLFQIISRKPARAGPVTVSLLIGEQPSHKILCKLYVRIKMIPRLFDLVIQTPVDLVHQFFGYAFIGSFLFFQPNSPLNKNFFKKSFIKNQYFFFQPNFPLNKNFFWKSFIKNQYSSFSLISP